MKTLISLTITVFGLSCFTAGYASARKSSFVKEDCFDAGVASAVLIHLQEGDLRYEVWKAKCRASTVTNYPNQFSFK